MWDGLEDVVVTAPGVTIEAKSAEAKAEEMRWFPWTIPGAFIIAAIIGGIIWWWMSSGNDEEKEEEGL